MWLLIPSVSMTGRSPRDDREISSTRTPSSRGIKQFADGALQTLHLRDVAGRDIRVADKEEVASKSKREDLLNRFAVLRTFEPVPPPEKDLVEPGRRLPQDVLEVGLEV